MFVCVAGLFAAEAGRTSENPIPQRHGQDPSSPHHELPLRQRLDWGHVNHIHACVRVCVCVCMRVGVCWASLLAQGMKAVHCGRCDTDKDNVNENFACMMKGENHSPKRVCACVAHKQ